jgi:hypothetical protein
VLEIQGDVKSFGRTDVAVMCACWCCHRGNPKTLSETKGSRASVRGGVAPF